jgi:hypothetical protein
LLTVGDTVVVVMAEAAIAVAGIWEGAVTWVAADTTMAGEATAAGITVEGATTVVGMGVDMD